MSATARYRVWVPVVDRIAVALTHRSIVHASAAHSLDCRPPSGVSWDRHPIRTLCGSDGFAVLHGVANASDPGLIVASWPPPRVHRCTDCERLAPVPRGQRVKGGGHWQGLIGVDRRLPPPAVAVEASAG